MTTASQLRVSLESMARGMLIGHQLGQWSERRWWNFGADGKVETVVGPTELLTREWLEPSLADPATITTPGWGPTGYGDLIPHILVLGKEYERNGRPLSPEQFRDFLLREKNWLRPQAVGRTCIELMSEGINPRVAGLFAPSVLPGCWIAWPIGCVHAGFPDRAYEDAVLLGRAQGGGDAVTLTGTLSAIVSGALVPGASWENVWEDAIAAAEKRDAEISGLLGEAHAVGAATENTYEVAASLKDAAFVEKVSRFPLDWLTDFYLAVALTAHAAVHRPPIEDLTAATLAGCDSRFGAMIVLSVAGALGSFGAIPEIWRTLTEDIHRNDLDRWVEGCEAFAVRNLRREAEISRRISPVLQGSVSDTAFYDKVLATFLAGAIGNVMGSPVEDRDYPWIVENHGIVNSLMNPGRLETEDDAAMTQLWAETYVLLGGRMRLEDLADTFRKKLKRSGYYYDGQHGYDLLMGEKIPPHACGHWNIVTGSSMMGCHPCGIYHAGDPSSAAADARELAYLWQRGFDVHGAAIMCAAVAEAISPGATVESVLDAALKAAPAEPQAYFSSPGGRNAGEHLSRALRVVEGFTDVLEVRSTLYRHFLEYNGQDPWEVVTFTLCIFKVADGDVLQCMIGGANIGRDSDTIASLSAVLGACLHGTAGIPEKFLSLFSEENMKEYKYLSRELVRLVKMRCLRSADVAEVLCSS